MPYIVLVTRDRLSCKRTFFCIIAPFAVSRQLCNTGIGGHVSRQANS